MKSYESKFKRAKKGGESLMKSLHYGKTLKGSHYIAAVHEKLIRYFETGRPYLNSSLTIQDVARDLCTNRGYVTDAIKMAGKKNFNYMLNEYRIKYALELFQSNPHLRVNELAYKSGFNSPTSFTMSFKLIVNMPPGEWCRRYKIVSGMSPASFADGKETEDVTQKNRSG